MAWKVRVGKCLRGESLKWPFSVQQKFSSKDKPVKFWMPREASVSSDFDYDIWQANEKKGPLLKSCHIFRIWEISDAGSQCSPRPHVKWMKDQQNCVLIPAMSDGTGKWPSDHRTGWYLLYRKLVLEGTSGGPLVLFDNPSQSTMIVFHAPLICGSARPAPYSK